METEIGESLGRIGKGLGEAAESVDQAGDQKRAQSLAQMRELVEGLESLQRRMLQRSRPNQANSGSPGVDWGAADGQSLMDRDFDPTDIADFRRDFAQRRDLLERLAGIMTSDEHGARDISRLLSEMRTIEQNGEFDDPQRAIRRQRQLIARLKELELRLTGEPDETKSRTLRLSGEDSVPRQYRPQVEEYFRELSRSDTLPQSRTNSH
jgi:hypothetical protein